MPVKEKSSTIKIHVESNEKPLLSFCRCRHYLQKDKEKLVVERHDLLHPEGTKPLKTRKTYLCNAFATQIKKLARKMVLFCDSKLEVVICRRQRE